MSLSPPPSHDSELKDVDHDVATPRSPRHSRAETLFAPDTDNSSVTSGSIKNLETRQSGTEGRTFYIRLDGPDPVRDRLEHILQEASAFVTLVVFHRACGFSTRSAGLRGSSGTLSKGKVADVVKNCFHFLLNANAGSRTFLWQHPPEFASIFDPTKVFTHATGLETESVVSYLQTNLKQKDSQKPLHAAAQALNSSIISVSRNTCYSTFTLCPLPY
jgi:hypothetical protein